MLPAGVPFFFITMRRLFSSLASFTRLERWGILALSGLVIALITVLFTMQYWVHPHRDETREQALLASWERYERSQPKVEDADDTLAAKERYTDASDDGPIPATININTADSATLVRLKGIGPATAAKIIARRRGHPFTSVDELLEIRPIPVETFAILKRHLVVR